MEANRQRMAELGVVESCAEVRAAFDAGEGHCIMSQGSCSHACALENLYRMTKVGHKTSFMHRTHHP